MIETFNTSRRLADNSSGSSASRPLHTPGITDNRTPSCATRQKRHSSNPYAYINAQFAKRRLAKQDDNVDTIFLDNLRYNTVNCNSTPNTPTKAAVSRIPSVSANAIQDTPQSTNSYLADNTPASPYYHLLHNSTSSPDLLPKATGGNGCKNLRFTEKKVPNPTQSISITSTPYIYQESFVPREESVFIEPVNDYSNKSQSIIPPLLTAHGNGEDSQINQDPTIDNSSLDTENNVDHQFNNTENDNNGENGAENSNESDQNNCNENNNNENGNNENNNDGNVPPVSVPPKRSSQALVQKLQDIYKIIVKQEIELQERCSQLTTSQTTELKNLWTIYRINSELINNYVTFITTALLPSQSEQDLLIGQEIVEIYRIERRLWVYGTITFLDVLKNFSNFMDPEVCSQFITHVFISISNMLADIPPKYAIPWLQRLGDLSRMAIALYPSGFIDWKLSAEYWYTEAMKFTYSHGKLYYHMSTVQQNTLEAFVNLGKSVFCQDTFIPSQQYMQLVIDNIYQRAFVERNNGNHRNTQLIEYLKHSEVMLLPSFLESKDLQEVVLLYFRVKFGLDSNEVDIFRTQQMFQQNPDQLKYFFRHAPAFAESHILQLAGFGDPKNPFALLFELPKFLKERRDKKEKRKSRASPLIETSSTMGLDEDEDEELQLNMSANEFFENIDSLKSANIFPASLHVWQESLKYINMTSMKCSMVVLQKFLQGSLVVALPHLLPWCYFIIAVALKVERLNDEGSREFWMEFLNRIFPWDTMVSFLNVLMAYILDNDSNSWQLNSLCDQYSQMSLQDLLELFNENEELPEVWKCWGTLWFDAICNKDQIHVDSYKSAGIKDHMFLDTPIDGIGFDHRDETGEKFCERACRAILLFRGIAQRFKLGISLSFNASVYCRRDDVASNHFLRSFSFKLGRNAEFTGGQNADLSILRNTVEVFETGNWVNIDIDAIPMLSVVEHESIFDYEGYKRLYPDYCSYDKSGEFISTSLYTSLSADNINNQNMSNSNINHGDNQESTRITKDKSAAEEKYLFEKCVEPGSNRGHSDNSFQLDDPMCQMNARDTYFVLDATSWLRHFGHVYKLATNKVLKFAICLTTFQELRFLRKSKDENVVEAATRAIITVRQLYSEKNILPLRFTGNVATHIEEHLEFEEQITWRSHVDEFVIEAVMKAQDKFEELSSSESKEEMQDVTNMNVEHFNYAVLITDDGNMRKKAQDQGIRTFSTRFVFSICNAIGLEKSVCTN